MYNILLLMILIYLYRLLTFVIYLRYFVGYVWLIIIVSIFYIVML